MLVAICDDNAAAREKYSYLVSKYAKDTKKNLIPVVYSTGTLLLFDLEESKREPDILLLDILMPDINGIEVAKKLRDRGFIGEIIFISRFSEYALEVFDVKAFNFLVKDDSLNELERFADVFPRAVESMENKKKKYLLLTGMGEHRNIAIDSIRYFESNKHIITCHYGDKDEEFQFISSLGKVESKLMEYLFVRVQRSFIVNAAYVHSANVKRVIMNDGTEIPIGRKRYTELKLALKANAEVDGLSSLSADGNSDKTEAV